MYTKEVCPDRTYNFFELTTSEHLMAAFAFFALGLYSLVKYNKPVKERAVTEPKIQLEQKKLPESMFKLCKKKNYLVLTNRNLCQGFTRAEEHVPQNT